MNLQIIKINGVYEIILGKPCLVVALEFFDVRVQPDWFAQVKFIADGVQSVEDLMCPGIVVILTDNGIPDHSIVFEFLSP